MNIWANASLPLHLRNVRSEARSSLCNSAFISACHSISPLSWILEKQIHLSIWSSSSPYWIGSICLRWLASYWRTTCFTLHGVSQKALFPSVNHVNWLSCCKPTPLACVGCGAPWGSLGKWTSVKCSATAFCTSFLPSAKNNVSFVNKAAPRLFL